MNGRLPALIAVAVALSQCTKPTSPPDEYQALGAWLARQGIPAPAGGPPAVEAASKAAGGHRLLGDATGNGEVTFWDLWPLWQYLTGKTYMVEHYDFDLLDIDRDGDNDWDDLKHLGRFLYVAESGNPWKIGEPLAPPILAALSPSPSELDLVPDGTLWQRLTLSVTALDGAASTEEVRVRVNPEDTGSPVLEIARRTTAPGDDWCAGEPNDTKTGDHGRVFWLAGCQAGDGAVQILDGDDNLLASYPVTVREPPSDDPSGSFDIELVFDSRAVFTERQKALIRLAADRWEEVITGDLDDVDVGVGGETDVVDDLRISVGDTGSSPVWAPPDVGAVAWVTGERPNGTPYLARTVFKQSGLRFPNPSLVRLALHEIGHCLGIGTGEAWQALRSADGYSFTGPLAIQAFDEAGGSSYAEKVPTESDGSHWRSWVFTMPIDPNRREETAARARGELMSSEILYGSNGVLYEPPPDDEPGTSLWIRYGPDGFGYVLPWVHPNFTPTAWSRPLTRLSAITVAALADMGYEVDFSQAEPYTLPEPLPADKRVAAWPPPLVCGVGHVAGPPWAP